MQELLARLPAVHALADAAAARGEAPRWAVVEAARRAIARQREAILAGRGAASIDPREVAVAAEALARPALRRVINGTGVVLHTNLGRAPLAEAARAAIEEVSAGYSNLEYDVARGDRGSRHDHLRGLLRELTGAEDAVVVNNNAAATVLGLAALAEGRQVVVSRGELIEIGGSFRLPEILALSRGVLVEVGTTNKTHRRDYEAAIGPETGLLLKVHRSNFAIVGFTSEVPAEEVVSIGRARGVATMIDLGSGALVDRATQRRWGLPDEPTVAETVGAGADLVTFSGDKLLGGPQAGIIVGRAHDVERVAHHPLARAVRADKSTLAGVAATLRHYARGEAEARVPVWRMIAAPEATIRQRAETLAASLRQTGRMIAVEPVDATVGGGSLPGETLPSWALVLHPDDAESIDALARRIRLGDPGVFGRIDRDRLLLDLRTVLPEDDALVESAIGRAFSDS
jgi:L-seryl-tRNA(Ser) seleniumtransferase